MKINRETNNRGNTLLALICSKLKRSVHMELVENN